MKDEYIITIDGGTSNTRLHLLKNGNIMETYSANVGASENLEQAIGEGIAHLSQNGLLEIKCFLGAGMITSNIGLIYLEHNEGVFDPNKLCLTEVSLKHIHPSPFYFCSGVRFCRKDLSKSDLIKGEEVEIYGILKDSEADENVLILHFGTHNKAILVEKNCIVDSITTLGGEMLWTIANYTILKNSVSDFDNFIIEESFVKQGYEFAKKYGVSRCLFLGRVGQVLYGMEKAQVLSFLYGVIVQSDFMGFEDIFQTHLDKIILYGREPFVKATMNCIENFKPKFIPNLRCINYEESEMLSPKGLYHIYKCQKQNSI